MYDACDGIKVFQNVWYRWLTYEGDAIQTLLQRKDYGRPVLPYIKPITKMVKRHPGTTCVFGLGGGAIAHHLSSRLHLPHLSVVEKSPRMIEVAKEWFGIQSIPGLNIHCEAVETYVKNDGLKFQHLIIDIAHNDGFPEACSNVSFFQSCHELLESGGFMMVNLPNEEAHYQIFKIIREVFNQCTLVISVQKTENLVILGAKVSTMALFYQELQNNYQNKKIKWDPVWGYVCLG